MKHGQKKRDCRNLYGALAAVSNRPRNWQLRTQMPRQARDTIEKQSRDNLLAYAQIRMVNNLGDKSSDRHCQRSL